MDRRVLTLIGSAAVLAVIVAVVLIARGGDDSEEAPADGEKPTVEVPEGDPPTELEIEDIEEGEGAEAQEGDQLSVDYVGVLYDNGKEFDNSYDTGTPLPVTLGEGGLIPGFEQGLEGMKEGGQRQITIPPDLGYGAQGQPPEIPPDSTLIFVVELVSIN
jgi:peptidylprolyl isomerase